MKYRVVHVMRDVHSAAFADVCELLFYSLADLGRDVDYSVKLSASRLNIVVGANQLDEPIPEDVEYIVLQLEQLPGKWWTPAYRNIIHEAEEVWDYDPHNQTFLYTEGIHAKLVTLGYHEQLNRIEPMKKQIDVLHYGSANDRRRKVLDECRTLGLNVQSVFGVYGHDRDMLVAQSKVVLNCHFYPEQIFEQARVSYLLNNGVTVVSESSEHDPYSNVPFVRSSYARLPETCIAVIDRGCDGALAQQEFKNKYDMKRILKEIP